MHAYLKRVFDAAQASPVTDPEQQDVWDTVSQLLIDGEQVTREEMVGMAGVLLVGGRDTVIKVVTGFMWHVLRNPEDREFLTENESAHALAMVEMVRYLSPLSKMERVRGEDKDIPVAERDRATEGEGDDAFEVIERFVTLPIKVTNE